MKVEDVKKLEPLERLKYWITERHAIHLRRLSGAPRPWTDDAILRNYFFTNPFRENDKTTVWFRESVRRPLADDRRVLVATVIFRWFNLIETGKLLLDRGLLHKWDGLAATELLVPYWDNGQTRVFTGAFMIKGANGPRGCKIPSVCAAITEVVRNADWLLDTLSVGPPTLRGLWQLLRQFRYLGGFMAYEIVCDLRWTFVLRHATDVLTWCNQGPGAKRGLNRLLGRALLAPIPRGLWEENTARLLDTVRALDLPSVPHAPEMREVEHSLCEFDKYCRALEGGPGRMKRRYNGGND